MKLLAVMASAILFWAVPAGAVTVERVVSPGGIEAWLIQDHSNPIISMSLAFRGGAALDPEDRSGLADMAASLLDEGAGDLDSQAFQGRLRDLAISIGFGATQDTVYGRMKTLVEHEGEAFSMLRLALSQPRFDPEAVERIRSQMLADLARQLQDPETIAGRAFASLIYRGHPYGRAVDGIPATVKAITRDDLAAFVRDRLGRDKLYVAVVGDITPERLKARLDATFGALPATTPPIAVPEAEIEMAGRTEIIRRDIPQSVVVFGEQGIKRDDPDWYAAYVMNYILGGGGFSSRLMTEIRVKRGLSYGVYSYLAPNDHGALIAGSVSTRNDRVAESLRLVRQEWSHMAANGVSAQELADAKTYLSGSFPLQMDSTHSIASLLISIQLDGLGIDYIDRRAALINAVSVADIARVAKRLLDAGRLSAVVVGDPEGL